MKHLLTVGALLVGLLVMNLDVARAEQRGTKVETGSAAVTLESVQGQYCHVMGDEETPAKAKKAAEARAREAAVASYRVYVQSSSTVKNFELEADVIENISAGLLQGARTTYEEKGREFCAAVTAKIDPAKVQDRIQKLVNAKDIATQAQAPVLPSGSAFGVRVWANKQPGQPFVEGDPLVINVQSDRDGYLKVDYYQADGNVVHLVPNAFRGDVFVRAGQVYTFGGEGGSEKFTITPPFGNETIKAFVSTQRIDDPVSASRSTEDSREYLKDLKRGTRGVGVGAGDGKAQWAESALGLETRDKATEQHVTTRGGTRGVAKMIPTPKGPSGSAPDYTIVPIFYATDRRPTGDSQPVNYYGGDRGALELGICDVSIPKDHRMGELEAPSIWKLEFKEDPSRHVILLRVTPQPSGKFYSNLRERIAKSPRKEAFVFVHGYNVPFADAARRTAQIAYDLKFPGAPILYSWPSQGRLSDYPVDETNVEWTVPHLKEFLAQLSASSGAQTVHLIAHSMGNRALTRALQQIALGQGNKAGKPKFSEVVLTAPDIDAEVFMGLAQEISRTAKRVTMYGSSKDEALNVSKKFHGYRRAGDTQVITVAPGVDTIDATLIDTSLVGHSYFGDNTSVIADLKNLFFQGKAPEARSSLQPGEYNGQKYWIFRP